VNDTHQLSLIDPRDVIALLTQLDGIRDEVPEASTPRFGDSGMGGRKLPCQLDSFIRFDRTPTCDRQTPTDRQTDRRRAIASIAARASTASRAREVWTRCVHHYTVEVCGNRFFVPVSSHFNDFIPIPV